MIAKEASLTPFVLRPAPPLPLRIGERWPEYKERVAGWLDPVIQSAKQSLSLVLHPLIAANGVHGQATDEQMREIHKGALGREMKIEWRPETRSEPMAALSRQVEMKPFRSTRGEPVGREVRVAVLDSGIDLDHPHLWVADSVSTCPETCEVPGRHGTFCAGLIAARHGQYCGLAPAVYLLNIKVARSNGWTSPVFLARGIDEALEHRADILSISCGLNQDEHCWVCLKADCILCRAVNNAVHCGAVVVAAAGNRHRQGRKRLRTELLCPGQARGAITVGATERAPSSELYPLSSYGPTADGFQKPDLVAPGADAMSTIPVSSASADSPFLLFGLGSGTSVAAARVAGAVALLIQRKKRSGEAWTPSEIRRELLTHCVRRLDGKPPEAVGAGCLDLSKLHRYTLDIFTHAECSDTVRL